MDELNTTLLNTTFDGLNNGHLDGMRLRDFTSLPSDLPRSVPGACPPKDAATLSQAFAGKLPAMPHSREIRFRAAVRQPEKDAARDNAESRQPPTV
jgi:hypothetical protein